MGQEDSNMCKKKLRRFIQEYLKCSNKVARQMAFLIWTAYRHVGEPDYENFGVMDYYGGRPVLPLKVRKHPLSQYVENLGESYVVVIYKGRTCVL
jgi:hypothetical protein